MEEIAPVQPPNVDETCGPTNHPLENAVVLKTLFELIPFKLNDFQSFRLVSRAWKNVSLSTWRKTATIFLYEKDPVDQQDDKNVTHDSEDGKISWQKYLELLKNNEHKLVQHPFRKFSLRSCKIVLESVNEDGEQGQLRFWSKVGPLMTHLTLNFCEFVGVADFRTVLFEKTPNLQSLAMYRNIYPKERPATRTQRRDPKLPQHSLIPLEQAQNNLKEFNVQFTREDNEDEVADEDENEVGEVVDTFPNPTGSRFPITWMEFLIRFPNIKRLGGIIWWLEGSFRLGSEADFLEFFETVEILRREHGSRYLADLDDLDLLQHLKSRGFGQQLFSTINRLRFPFERLSFQVNKTVDEETFKQLLQNPLKYLEVERTVYQNHEVRPFQNFPFGLNFVALKQLGLWGPIAPNLVFLKKCPNLEKFIYSPFPGNRLDDLNLTQGLGDIATKLEKLKCLSIDCGACNAEEIRKLGELMPNVTDLEVGLNDESFRAACEVWKDLEYLRLGSWEIGEEALLGKDQQSGKNFRHPNLTDLKKLKAFVMARFRKERDQQGFTDAMILDGILALPKLEQVSLLISSEVSS